MLMSLLLLVGQADAASATKCVPLSKPTLQAPDYQEFLMVRCCSLWLFVVVDDDVDDDVVAVLLFCCC